MRSRGKAAQERSNLGISASAWLAALTLGRWYSAALSAACQACRAPVSGARAGPSLVWASSCRGDPYLPSLAASGSSDIATLYPVHETKPGLDLTGTNSHTVMSTDINGLCNYRIYTGKHNQLNP